jgi:hypothetical protein
LDELKRSLTVAGLSHDFQARFRFNYLPQAVTKDRVIVGYDNPEFIILQHLVTPDEQSALYRGPAENQSQRKRRAAARAL